jgi:hypothetical protein
VVFGVCRRALPKPRYRGMSPPPSGHLRLAGSSPPTSCNVTAIIDHVFPISYFTPARLKRGGVSELKIEELGRLANELPNLQLLEGAVNIEKRASPPAAWLPERYPTESDREYYRSTHLLGAVPEEIDGPPAGNGCAKGSQLC